MWDRLLPVFTAVENGSVSAAQAFVLCNTACHDEEVAHQLTILLLDVVKTGDRLSRAHEDVGWCLRVDIAECETRLILEHDLGRYLSVPDLLK